MADVDGGDENDEEGEADGDDDSDVVVGRGGVAIGEVHLIGPGFLRRCCAHVQAVLLAVLEMGKFFYLSTILFLFTIFAFNVCMQEKRTSV